MFTDHVYHKQTALIGELCMAMKFAYYPVQQGFLAHQRVYEK